MMKDESIIVKKKDELEQHLKQTQEFLATICDNSHESKMYVNFIKSAVQTLKWVLEDK